jgi:hypothetical protein
MKIKSLLTATFSALAIFSSSTSAWTWSDDERSEQQPAPQVASLPASSLQVTFEGKSMNLMGDWGAARACLINRARGVAECYRSEKQAESRAQRLAGLPTIIAGTAPAGVTGSCAAPLKLSWDSGGQGRVLRWYDKTTYFQNVPWDFNDEASWYETGSCSAHLAEHADGRGYWYPGYTGPRHSENVRIDWNDRISSIQNF